MSTGEKVKKEEVVKPEEEVAEVPEVQPVDVEEAEAEMVEVEEEAPAEVVEEEKPPVEEEAVAEEAVAPEEALPNIFVSDSSTPPKSLTGPRILYVLDEKRCYPMNNEVNAWVHEHNVPIKVPTEVEAQIKEFEIEGQNTLPDLAQLTKKLEA